MKCVTRTFRLFILLTTALFLAGCVSSLGSKSNQEPNVLPFSSFFKGVIPSQIESPQDLFSLTPELKTYVTQRLLIIDDPYDRAQTLRQDLFDQQQLNLEYVSNANQTATQVIKNRQANCLSLTILVWAIANEAHLSTTVKKIDVVENWIYTSGITLLNDHVNITVNDLSKDGFFGKSKRSLTIDFFPLLRSQVRRTTHLTKSQVVALFYNNKGADALIARNNSLAYRYFEEALKFGPELAASWVNMGVLYRRFGLEREAEKAFNFAISLDFNNLNAMENLANLYKATGRKSQSDAIMSKITKSRMANPYFHALLGDLYFAEQRYVHSLRMFKRAVKMNPGEYLFHLGLYKNYLALNRLEKAKKSKRTALKIQKQTLPYLVKEL